MRVNLVDYSNLGIGTAAFCSAYMLYLSFSQVRKIMMVAGTALGLLGGVAAAGVCIASMRSDRDPLRASSLTKSSSSVVLHRDAAGAGVEVLSASASGASYPFEASSSYLARFFDNPHVQFAGDWALRAKGFLDTGFVWVQGRLASGYGALTQREKDLLNNSVTKALVLGLIFFKLGK